MTRHRTSLRAISREKIAEWAEAGEEFTAASMSGVVGYYGPGWLDREWADRYYADRDRVRYTVLSYATPIAWLTPEGWVIVTQDFSPTTTQHQYNVWYLRPVVGEAPEGPPGSYQRRKTTKS
jgi:hypothetical protein